MRWSRRDGWTIDEVTAVCRNFDLDAQAPSGGSHYVVSHPGVEGLLTIPATRPIKPIYVQLLTQLIESVESR